VRDESDTEKDSTTGLSSPPWRVVSVRVCAPYRLEVEFADRTRGEVDMARFLSAAEAGVFAKLRDATEFARVYVDHGAVTWPGELDLAPDAMHAAIIAEGRWVP
jgi:hypothetical protein